MQERRGCGAEKRREAIFYFEAAFAAPRRICGLPAAFQGFPPSWTFTRWARRASDSRRTRDATCARHCSPLSPQERLERDPFVERDASTMRVYFCAGISLCERIANNE